MTTVTGMRHVLAHQVVDGYIALPSAPGLGIDLDEDALARFPYEPFPTRSPRRPHEEGP